MGVIHVLYVHIHVPLLLWVVYAPPPISPRPQPISLVSGCGLQGTQLPASQPVNQPANNTAQRGKNITSAPSDIKFLHYEKHHRETDATCRPGDEQVDFDVLSILSSSSSSSSSSSCSGEVMYVMALGLPPWITAAASGRDSGQRRKNQPME
ncbi:hypothetical protein E2C01_094293 [Portunus trituberculatus]|uniref:Uncharacterized protein n=1 Tax=Portunus trituberculatus TaxID=210409 RepID=A0A5B7K0E6_PORTR|nr:hypothetical protein [Portunus trituberculatus]